jgi:hypothetical protein
MARLLCVARWPEDGLDHPDNAVEFAIELTGVQDVPGQVTVAKWVECNTALLAQSKADGPRRALIRSQGRILSRDLRRLVDSLKALHERHLDSMTFMPVAPCFELWLQRLSDDQYRVIIWQDLADQLDGASNIAHQGVRFTTNRARLLGFVRGLEAELDELTGAPEQPTHSQTD